MANHLFEVSKTAGKLSKRDAQAFHRIVAKLFFLCKRARPDILTGVKFLTERVREPSGDDDKKLGRIPKYIIGTRDLVLTLESNDTGMVKWWVDVESMMSMGRGSLYSASNKQKLNMKSLTEADLVGVDDLMPKILWMQ